jgi:ATP-dependent Lon protease
MKENKENLRKLPLIPLREMIVFPSTLAPFLIGRHSSIAAFEYAVQKKTSLFLSTQINPAINYPTPPDIFTMGIEARIVQSAKSKDGTIKIVVEGIKRGRIIEYSRYSPFFEVVVKDVPYLNVDKREFEKHYNILLKLFKDFIKINSGETLDSIIPSTIEGHPLRVLDIISSQIPLPIFEKQNLLEIINPIEKIIRLNYYFSEELRIRKIKDRLKKVKGKKLFSFPEKNINEDYENKEAEQLSEIEELREKLKKLNLSNKARKIAENEINKLEIMPPISAETTVTRNYIDWIFSIPWKKKTRDNKNIDNARKILEEDHYGLKDVKERILEFLAVRTLKKNNKSPILCFVGPPGVGKSSLGKSIARSMGRRFVRLSLGGIRDEAEIKGHRRTYIGSYPGQIIQQIKRGGVKNPVFLLDEVDKMTADFRGDPAAALLEVLDPEQNNEFVDRYLDIEFDLSDVFFITTANNLYPIPSALRDRMEIIELPGYTEFEKLAIAKEYLIKKEVDNNGLKKNQIKITDEAILDIIRFYTRESGVRNLERKIAGICRKVALKIVSKGEKHKEIIQRKNLKKFLGPKKFHLTQKEETEEVGVVTGLAWTESGGDLLTFEVRVIPGKGELVLTGSLGDVMKESAQTAFSFVKNWLLRTGYDFSEFKDYDFHLHVPEGAVPKEGPSAGITISTALISLIFNIPVRNDVAMTGEVTLRGKILPIGGLKEKLIAANREKIKTIIIPYENKGDLEEIPSEIKKSSKIILVKTMEEVLKIALVRELKKFHYKRSINESFSKREN